MTFEKTQQICNLYHEKMFEWLEEYIGDTRKEVEEFLEDVLEPKLLLYVQALSISSNARFAECYLHNKPQFAINPGSLLEPWRLYPEQWEALEYVGDLLLCGGAATGKTRDFAARSLYVTAIKKADVLIVAHSQPAIDQIFNEILYQINHSRFLQSLFPKDGIKRGAGRESISAKYGEMRFRISGVRGDSIMSVHLGRKGLTICDEAAKYTDAAWEVITSRGVDNESTIVGGSIPYGKPGCRFNSYVEKGVDLETMKLVLGGQKEGHPSGIEFEFATVRWNREEQPGWNEATEKKAIRDHGGSKDHPSYKIYVQGLILNTENQVFLRQHLDAVFIEIPLYTLLRVVYDEGKKRIRCSTSTELNGILSTPVTEEFDSTTFDLGEWVLDNIPNVPVDIGGIDCGKIRDPHILGGFQSTNRGLRLRWRLITLYIPISRQAKLIQDLFRYEKRHLFRLGIGIEASGYTQASIIWEQLVQDWKIPNRYLSPFNWASKVVVFGDDNKPERDEHSHEIRRWLKHHLTIRMTEAMSNQEAGILGSFELPKTDSLLLEQFKEHSMEYHGDDISYDNENDHDIEMCRAAWGRMLEMRGKKEMIRARKDGIQRITTPREKREDL